MGVCECGCVYMSVWACVCECLCADAWAYVRVFCLCVYGCVCLYVYVCECVFLHVCVSVCVCFCAYAYVSVCMLCMHALYACFVYACFVCACVYIGQCAWVVWLCVCAYVSMWVCELFDCVYVSVRVFLMAAVGLEYFRFTNVIHRVQSALAKRRQRNCVVCVTVALKHCSLLIEKQLRYTFGNYWHVCSVFLKIAYFKLDESTALPLWRLISDCLTSLVLQIWRLISDRRTISRRFWRSSCSSSQHVSSVEF